MSLITIKGTDCRTAELGKVADRTGGKVCVLMCLKGPCVMTSLGGILEQTRTELTQRCSLTFVTVEFIFLWRLDFG